MIRKNNKLLFFKYRLKCAFYLHSQSSFTSLHTIRVLDVIPPFSCEMRRQLQPPPPPPPPSPPPPLPHLCTTSLPSSCDICCVPSSFLRFFASLFACQFLRNCRDVSVISLPSKTSVMISGNPHMNK